MREAHKCGRRVREVCVQHRARVHALFMDQTRPRGPRVRSSRSRSRVLLCPRLRPSILRLPARLSRPRQDLLALGYARTPKLLLDPYTAFSWGPCVLRLDASIAVLCFSENLYPFFAMLFSRASRHVTLLCHSAACPMCYWAYIIHH